MEKGKLGVKLNTWAIIGFVLALFGQTLLCGLLLGFVLYVEKDEKTARQCMTAFFLSLAWKVFVLAGGILFVVSGIISDIIYYRMGEALLGLSGFLILAVAVVMVVFTLIGSVNVCKGREAGVPILSALSERAFGFVKPRPQPQYPPQGYYPPGGQVPGGQPPPYGQSYQPPAQPHAAPPPPPPPPPPIFYKDAPAADTPKPEAKPETKEDADGAEQP